MDNERWKYGYQEINQNVAANAVNEKVNDNFNVNLNVKSDEKTKKSGSGLKKFFGIIGWASLFGVFAAAVFILTLAIFDKTGLIHANGLFGGASAQTAAVIVEPSARPTPSTSNTYIPDSTVTAVITDVTEVVEEKMPSIVSVINNYSYTTYYYENAGEASGSGIIVGSNDDELLIATNYHVIENNDDLTVVFCDDTSAPAIVKGTDADMDLAVIVVQLKDLNEDTLSSIAYASLGDSDALRVGEPVIAIGNALGYGQSVTSGVVSAVNRTIGTAEGNRFIQTDAAINPGNSGGALLNIAGELVGINSNKIGGSAVEGMGYAIPINVAKPIIENLMQRQTRTTVAAGDRGYLGVTGSTISRSEAAFYGFPDGVYVSSVTRGTPAYEAGIKEGDIIYSIDGEKVMTAEQLKDTVACYENGESITVRFYTYESDEYVCKEVVVTLVNRSDVDS